MHGGVLTESLPSRRRRVTAISRSAQSPHAGTIKRQSFLPISADSRVPATTSCHCARSEREAVVMSMKTAAALVLLLTVGCSSAHAKVGAHATPTHASPSAVTPSTTAADALLSRNLVRASDLPVGY